MKTTTHQPAPIQSAELAVTDDQVAGAVRAFVNAGKGGADMMGAIRRAVEEAYALDAIAARPAALPFEVLEHGTLKREAFTDDMFYSAYLAERAAQPIADVSAPTDERAAFDKARATGQFRPVTEQCQIWYATQLRWEGWEMHAAQAAARAAAPVSGQGAQPEQAKPTDLLSDVRADIVQAVSQGWCAPECSDIEMDSRLAVAICRNVQAVFDCAIAAPSIMPAEFGRWFGENYPPNTLIHDPVWHAPKIYRRAIRSAPAIQAQPLTDAEGRYREIGMAVERACGQLPDGYELLVELERDAGTVRLCFPDTEITEDDFDDCDSFGGKIDAAIDLAIERHLTATHGDKPAKGGA